MTTPTAPTLRSFALLLIAPIALAALPSSVAARDAADFPVLRSEASASAAVSTIRRGDPVPGDLSARGVSGIELPAAQLWDQLFVGSYLGEFEVPPDPDPYDGFPYGEYRLCAQEASEYLTEKACDHFTPGEIYGDTHAIVPWPERIDPVRGNEVYVWIEAQNHSTGQLDESNAVRMRAPLSNIALRPPGFENSEPYGGVEPRPDGGFEGEDGWAFRWPLTTTGTAMVVGPPGSWGGFNSGATEHVFSLQLTQSSASCEQTVEGCPAGDGTCSSTDPASCPGTSGWCNTTTTCSVRSDTVKLKIPLDQLTMNGGFVDVEVGWAQLRDDVYSNPWPFIEFFPHEETYEHLFSQVAPDRLSWSVATCIDVERTGTEEAVLVCGRPESAIVHRGWTPVSGVDLDPPDVEPPPPGPSFATSPLVDTFSHPACIACHVIERDARAGEGRGASHLNFAAIQSVEDFDDPAVCGGCHGAAFAPQILGTDYSAAHGLEDDVPPGVDPYDHWWSWFAPKFEGGLEWPEFLEDPESSSWDPATACILFTSKEDGGEFSAEEMKHHLFADPRVVWSIVGGDKPNGQFILELAPPGSDLGELSTQSERLGVLTTWETWVDDWVDAGMSCGSSYTGNSAGGGSDEAVNTTPPITSSDGSSGIWVGGAEGSGETTIAHLDCTPDVDSADPNCAWTLFACGSDDSQVESALALCDEESATPYTQAGTAPAGLCETASSGCYGFEPGVGGGTYWDLVEIPAEIGDHTLLAYRSIDAEGNVEAIRRETYDFVEADLIPPESGVELFYDVLAEEHKLRFTCVDNSEVCQIFFEVNDPGEDSTPEFDLTTDLLNTNGNAFDSHLNELGFLGTSQVRRIRFAAIDGAAGQKNAEFDRQCFTDALELCPGKLAAQNECVATCEAGVRSDCEASCSSGGATTGPDCVELCVADSPVDCLFGCEESCEPTNTVCPGDSPSPGETGCISRNQPIQCYHEFVYDPARYYDTDPPTVFAQAGGQARPDGTYPGGFTVALACEDPVNDCAIYFTEDGTVPRPDPGMLYTEPLVVPTPTTGRTATATFKFLAVDDAVPPNMSPVETRTYTVVLPHTDDDLDGFTEDEGDCNDDSDAIFPGAPEICDFLDNDCNGIVDDVPGDTCLGPEILIDGFESGDTSGW